MVLEIVVTPKKTIKILSINLQLRKVSYAYLWQIMCTEERPATLSKAIWTFKHCQLITVYNYLLLSLSQMSRRQLLEEVQAELIHPLLDRSKQGGVSDAQMLTSVGKTLMTMHIIQCTASLSLTYRHGKWRHKFSVAKVSFSLWN